MFLDAVLARNPGLVEMAAALHARGVVPPDTYVVDRDAVAGNAELLAAGARRWGLRLWCVVKQVGRCPELVGVIARHLPRFAAIDVAEARALRAVGAQAGNVGHLAQLPRRALDEVLPWRPEVVTVFDVENARAVSAAARRLGFRQDVLLRLESAAGVGFPGQEGGVAPESLAEVAERVEELPGVRIAGVTAFPCVRCVVGPGGGPRATANVGRLLRARALLESRGHTGLWLSAPGATSVASLGLLAGLGATHGEPGHALTGTTPLHAADLGQPERPAYVYVTEVAHTLADGRPAVFGGGFYPRSGPMEALLPRSGVRLPVLPCPPGNIDYYRLLGAPGARGAVRVGDTALLAFRTQMFVTRSTVAVVAGLSVGRPRVTGWYDALGRAR
ncbi:YhfX family PLP-dependent enzyme [Streptomyces sp. AJS327]|uniref:alanine racemase n=1 Tax=Streptomyces sp. AJS327 TaxID=2545265 RepID=UPI0015E03E2F|nr:alanine racemase [Streptomyces sp. AJS327]MBA0051805.1 YhfX family PLP-dependent enzyme [Streptomyces sp. AJS327]